MTKCCDNQELAEGIRGAIEARATWFYLQLQAMKEEEVNSDAIAKKAIFKAGQLNNVKMGMCNTPREFFDALATKNTSLAFDMEEIKVDEERGVYRFHKCALWGMATIRSFWHHFNQHNIADIYSEELGVPPTKCGFVL